MNIRSALNQRPYDLRMFFRHRPHQSSLPLLGLFRVRIGSVGQQQFHGLDVSGARTYHERRFPGPQRSVGIRSGLQQPLDHGSASIRASERQRSHSILVCRVYLGARANQKAGCFQIVPVGRPRQGGSSVGLGGIYIYVLSHERTHCRAISVLHCVHEPKIFRGSSKAEGAEQRDDRPTHPTNPGFGF